MFIDENYVIDKVGNSGFLSLVMGWIMEMEVCEDGIWGCVEWIKCGCELFED